jgi:hypothetical protein
MSCERMVWKGGKRALSKVESEEGSPAVTKLRKSSCVSLGFED